MEFQWQYNPTCEVHQFDKNAEKIKSVIMHYDASKLVGLALVSIESGAEKVINLGTSKNAITSQRVDLERRFVGWHAKQTFS